MRERILLFFVVIFGWFLLINPVAEEKTVGGYSEYHYAPEPPREIGFDIALKSITSASAKTALEYLASDQLEGRMSGKRGNILAGEFMKKEYEKLGLKTEYHKFPIRRVNPGPKNEIGDNFTQNVYAWIEGDSDEIVVVGAHYDHIGYGPSMSRSKKIAIHPGADDNASGSVALLEVAKAFSKVGKLKRTVVFQSYSAEEMGLIGSRYYCENPTFPKNNPNIKKHICMINMDMVGYLNKGKYSTAFFSGDSSLELGGMINELNGKYSFARNITSRGGGGSDHASFYNKKIPVAFLHTGLHDYYHTPADTADKINYNGIELVAKYAFELAYKVVQSDTKVIFNNASFKELPYTHDHGAEHFHFHD